MSRANYPAHRAFPTSILYRNKLVIYTPSLIFLVFFHRIRPLPSVLRKHLSAPHPGVHCCPGQSLIFTCGNGISLFRCFPFCKKFPKPFSKNSETAEDSMLMHIQILFSYKGYAKILFSILSCSLFQRMAHFSDVYSALWGCILHLRLFFILD